MNVFDTPMVLFSGTRIPRECFPKWAHILSLFFPLTYCINIIRFVLKIKVGEQNWRIDLIELIICLIVMFMITFFLIRKVEKHNRKTGELQFY